MIPTYPPEPRYGDAWENLKDAMREAFFYELMKEEENHA